MSRLIELSLVTLSLSVAMLADLAFSSEPASQLVKVIVYSQADVLKDKSVTLADLALLEGELKNGGKDLYAKEIYPRVDFLGKQGTLPGVEVGRALRAAIGQSEDTDYQIVLPEAVELTSSQTLVPHKRVEALIRAELTSLCQSCRVTIRDLKIPALGVDAATGKSWEFSARGLSRGGSFLLPLTSTDGNGKLWVSGSAVIEQLAYAAKRSISVGEKLSEADFERRWIDVSFAKDAVAELGDLSNSIATRPLSLNQALYRKDLRKSYAVRKGQVMKAISIVGDLEVTRELTAEEPGYVGDLIRLKAADSKKIIMGTVIDSDKARVE